MDEEGQAKCFLTRLQDFLSRHKFTANFCKQNVAVIGVNEVHKGYDVLAQVLLHPQHAVEVVNNFRQEFPQILYSAIPLKAAKTNLDHEQHVLNCIILSKVLNLHPDVHSFTLQYFNKFASPFDDNAATCSRPKKSKVQWNREIKFTDADIVNASYEFLHSNTEYFRHKWNWSRFFQKYSKHKDNNIRWVVCQCLAIITGMNERKLQALMSKYSVDVYPCAIKQELESHDKSVASKIITSDTYLNKICSSDFLISIGGISISVFDCENVKNTNIVEVDSTINNLRRIALGLVSKEAICLNGAIGSGKTSLVDYLAAKTGRTLGRTFVKLQLGDQTDSKMLLGSYHCTDVPGEFVWQPGILTQAVTEGLWLLLEDIDSASMDVASVLAGLLETRSLIIPGSSNIKAHSDFQLFLTQRLVTTATGHHKKYSQIFSVLKKDILEINIDSLTTSELEEIIQTLYPPLKTIANRMVSVFNHFNALTVDGELPRLARPVSTRDLFKWCARASSGFDVTSQQSALRLLQDAIDIFCCSFADSQQSLKMAKIVSTHLGIVDEKAVYFLENYKPHLNSTPDTFTAGRASLKRQILTYAKPIKSFCYTRQAANLLERTACCVNLREPVLFVGETGTGKTSCVQYVADTIGQKLIVINMNQQSDSADLLGGFKPVDMKFIVAPIKLEFENLFIDYFDSEKNQKYLGHINYTFNEQKWSYFVKLVRKSYDAAMRRLSYLDKPVAGEKRPLDKSNTKRTKDEHFLKRWSAFGVKLQKLELQVKHKNSLAFAFVEGSLINAIKNGYWVLLDEINLANPETLECLSGLLEDSVGSLSLFERGDKEPIKRHPDFTLFACMNPSTDVGKKDLPYGLRNRFTEFYVPELTDKNDLMLLIRSYLHGMSLGPDTIKSIMQFYLNVRKEATLSLCDDLGHKPHFSLRSLCRALTIAAKGVCGSFEKSIYEAFCLTFLTQLDRKSYEVVENLIILHLFGSHLFFNSVRGQPNPKPSKPEDYLKFEGYWVRKGTLQPEAPQNYILTPSVRKNLKDLVRVVSIGKLPVLLQGDTSVGKTSLITFLAKASGNKCVRINNHEHTDLQEYIGSYVADSQGKLVFREGLLVEAMRKGHWIILDELNLAPSDVLEALNRVLDDNQELFIPETQEVVKADPNFMLFATQNPPGLYGGRKMLSRAFRNRFVELHFNEIPLTELVFILHKRCELPFSYATKIVDVMKELQIRRRGSATFAGKQGFITLRDLFRWGERYRLAKKVSGLYDWDRHLADEGYLVLSSKVRKPDEKLVIIEVLKKILKCEVVPRYLFTLCPRTSTVTRHILEELRDKQHMNENIVWTYNMRQTAVLMRKAQEFNEPVLLVGETGGGKTTICKILAEMSGQELVTVNCHMHTESGDFIGGLHPVRDHTGDNLNKLFEWVDGPLINAMKTGNVFLADEISLADDSILERLNSLLEPERTLLLAEKGADLNNTDNSELIVAHQNFKFIGTMNPSGDFGKKELSPALRNRFTEIWCETCTERDDLIAIIKQNLNVTFGDNYDLKADIANCIMDFVEFFARTNIGSRYTITVRDILTWVGFVNNCLKTAGVGNAIVHGACLTFLDALGSGVTSTESNECLKAFSAACIDYLQNQLKSKSFNTTPDMFNNLQPEIRENYFGINPFYVEMGENSDGTHNFSFSAPTTAFNTLRLLRGMQLNKAILLEGSPGVGKTSLVIALAKATRNKVLRVNLSDQTDISDLFGADLPVENGDGGQFAWRDGPLLQALKQGHWILLDELNLASQSVLEGLNACLDHRGEIFVPELGKTFHVQKGTRFFACQNPLKQGGSRRGLPKSFLNRFIQVYINELEDTDLYIILKAQFPQLPDDILTKMIKFNMKVMQAILDHTLGTKGSPWEYNLRDMTRWCEIMLYRQNNTLDDDKIYSPQSVVHLIYCDRMRTLEDRKRIEEMFRDVFGCEMDGDSPVFYVNNSHVFVGDVSVERNTSACNVNVLNQSISSLVLRKQLPVLRSLMYCVNLNWMSILVGKSDSGKTGIIKTLASIAEKPLHILPVTSAMDTTDILGGFEQTDYTRHLEEIHRRTEHLLLEAVQKLEIEAGGEEAINLLAKWEDYRNYQGTQKNAQNLTEQTHVFIRHLKKLLDILQNLSSKIDKTQCVTTLTDQTKSILYKVEAEGSLNAGGKFEWVDSVLIKCLQEGSWLVIDNVNLCSPAVLDRLNGLLEPNGELVVSERGVGGDGKMVVIKPHKDFRLFLTMDPKQGEISRAMRNRGIEIYVLDESESKKINTVDLKSLISLKGLQNNDHINALTKIHEFVSDLVLGEKPGTSHLLQSSFLINQQIQRGVGIYAAFQSTIIDVYYKTRSLHDFNTNDPVMVIKTKIKEVISDYTPQDDTNFYSQTMTLKTDFFQKCCAIEKVKQQTSVLHWFLTNCSGNSDFLSFLLIHVFSITNKEDLKYRYLFLKTFMKDRIHKEIIEGFLQNLQEFAMENLTELPMDIRWFPVIKSDRNKNTSNKIFFMNYMTVQWITINQQIARLEEGKGKLMVCYLRDVQLKKMEAKIDDVVITEFLNLFEHHNKWLYEAMSQKDLLIEDSVLIQLISLMKWSFILYKCAAVDVQKISPAEMDAIIQNLHVHYRWFSKYSMRNASSLLNTPLKETLLLILNKIDQVLIRKFSLLRSIAKRYQKATNHPPPLINKTQLDVLPTFNALSRKFDFYDGRNDFEKVLDFLDTEKELRHILVDLNKDLDYDFKEVSEDFHKLKILVGKYKEGKTTDTGNKQKIHLLPIIDYFNRLLVLKIRGDLEVENYANLLRNAITINPSLAGALLQFIRTRDERLLHKINSESYYYLFTAAVFSSHKFFSYQDHREIADVSAPPQFSPLLSYAISELMIPDNNSKDSLEVKYGQHKEIVKQRKTIGMLLWSNLQQVSSKKFDLMNNEIHYVTKSFNLFVTSFAKSLGLEGLDPSENCLKAIGELLEDKYSNITSQDAREDKNLIVSLLTESYENLNQLRGSQNIDKQAALLAMIYMKMGYLKSLITSQIPIIDPLKKVALKRKYCVEEIQHMMILKQCYELQNVVYSGSDKTLHAYCHFIEESLQKLKGQSDEYNKYVAVRPDDSTYTTLLKVVEYAFSTVLSPSNYKRFLHNLWEPSSDCSQIHQNLAMSASFLFSCENFIRELSAHRFTYPDIVEPLLSNVMEFLYGLKLGIEWKKASVTQDSYMLYLKKLAKFPHLDYEQISSEEHIKFYTSKEMQNFLRNVLSNTVEDFTLQEAQLRLIKCGVQDVYDICLFNPSYSADNITRMFSLLNMLIQTFVHMWNKQEDEKELKKKENESLYKIKSKCDKTEEELAEEEFNSLFPTFHDIDFSDMHQKDLSDDVASPLDELAERVNISKEDVAFVTNLHCRFVTGYTGTEWLKPDRERCLPSFVQTLIEKLKVFKLLMEKSMDVLNYKLDSELLATLNILVAVSQNYGDVNIENLPPSPSLGASKKQVNFYKDSSVNEVQSALYVLEELSKSVKDLFEQWPDHPTLNTILVIIDRVYSFPVTSPLSRFLTGFELLLTKCNEWEEVAHSGVSLSQHAQNITQHIISWRKQELNMWRDCLNYSFQKLNEPVTKWWLYLYNIMQQVVVDVALKVEDLVVALQKFMTQSNLAEFENRLHLIKVFHCHATYLEKSESRDNFISVLWNIHQYFSQFLPNVNAKIKELKAPIEKKLKDYVKIVRWKDISYWAVKETLQKTHRTLHKHMREFERCLSQPVTPYLTIPESKSAQNVGIWDRPQRNVPKEYHYTIDSALYMSKKVPLKSFDTGITRTDLVVKSERYFNKARTLCKDAIDKSKYPTLIKSLEGFITEVIETSEHLQGLEVDKTVPKKKQISQAKNILQQKRRALSELFKSLSKIGFSYKSGLIPSKNSTDVREFLMKPLDLSVASHHLKHIKNNERLLTIWDGCEMYYSRCISRMNMLETALNNPEKSLGMQNVERCKGYSYEIMNAIYSQKEKLIETSRHWYYIKHYLKCFEGFTESSTFIHKDTVHSIEQFLENVWVVTAQLKIFLHTCPEECESGEQIIEIPVLESDAPNNIRYKNDSQWNNTMDLLKKTADFTQKLASNILKSRSDIPCVELHLSKPSYENLDCEMILQGLDELSVKINEIWQIFGGIPSCSSLEWLLQEAHNLKDKLVNKNCSAEDTKTTTFTVLEELTEKILIIVQKIYKKYNSVEILTDFEDTEDSCPLLEKHLSNLVMENMFEDITMIEMKNLFTMCDKLAADVLVLNPIVCSGVQTAVSQVVPLLEQVTLLCHYFLTQQVSTYRITCKMGSILLNIFIDLVTKGFCIPPELSEEIDAEGEGKTSSGMGLGDGEGEKDVSDKIESEDQLEDAQPADADKKQEDDKDCKEEDNAIEMSDDFDSKLQDVKEKADDKENDNSDSDGEEQMGETEEDSEKLDKQLWDADESEPENEECGDKKEERGDKGEEEEEGQLGASENATDNTDQPSGENEKKEQQKKEINEMDEKEYDDDQTDPYHGNQPELPEPEPMDLPDNLELDEENDEAEQQEENPFDVDQKKEQFLEETEEKDSAKEEEQCKEKDAESDSSEDEHGDEMADDTKNENKPEEEMEVEENDGIKESEENPKDQQVEDSGDQSAPDNTISKQNQAQAMELDTSASVDNVQNAENDNNQNKSIESTSAENKPDQESTGQSKTEEDISGHSGDSSKHATQPNERKEEKQQEQQKRPGESDSKRSLGDVNEPVQKRLKTVKPDNKHKEESDLDRDQQDAEMVQHIEEVESSSQQVLDTATKEQAEAQNKEIQNSQDKNEEDENMQPTENLPPEEEDVVEEIEVEDQKARKIGNEKYEGNKNEHPKGEVLEEMESQRDIKGDIIPTHNVGRGIESSHHTQYTVLADSRARPLSTSELNQLRADIERQLSHWHEPPPDHEAEQTWQKIISVTSTLAQDLSEQLRLILEPTQASRLKGDYRTGKRINMRKVIPYIASQFRKDKIWLRRSKPSKREYQIVLAIDDSSSMADNRSKELAFESVALISKALTLLESGQLGVLSFGEKTEVVHKLTEPFSEKSGSNLLQKFKFTQEKTYVADLVRFATEVLVSSPTNVSNAKLLIIISDGRLSSDNSSGLQQAIRQAKSANIFMVFIIVDNPNNKDSILDIRKASFVEGKCVLESYMDHFPFPFYVILKDIAGLPGVLSDALRQWFEIVSNIDRI